MTNREYCNKLYIDDLALICRVVNHHLSKRCDRYATAAEKEVIFNEWYSSEYNPDEWSRQRYRTELNKNQKPIVRVGCVKDTLPIRVSAF